MANANAIKMGGGYVQLFTDNSAMVRGLKNARKDFDSWAAGIAKAGAGLAAVGGAGLAGGMAAVKQFADAGGALDDISQRTGASVESLSRLKFAAQMGGTSIEAVEGATKKLQKRLIDAARGNKEAADSFIMLGLSAQDLMRLPLDQQMAAIGDAITAIDDPALRASAAMDVLGKSGSDLIPMFNGLSDAVKRADKLGLTWTAEDAERAAELGDRLDELTDVALRTVEIIGGQLAPVVMGLTEPLLDAAVATKEFIAENPGVVEGALAATVVIGGLGVALVGTAGALTLVGSSLGVLASVFSATIAPLVMPAAIVGLGYVIETQTGIASKSIDYLAETFPGVSEAASAAYSSAEQSLGMLVTDAKDAGSQVVGTWHGIVNAVSSGDLELAGEIAMAGLNAAWLAGTLTIRDSWDTVVAAVLSAWTDTTSEMQVVGKELYAWFESIWVDVKGFAIDAFDGIITKWNETIGALADITVDIGIATGIIGGDAEEIKRERRAASEAEQKARDEAAAKRMRESDQARQEIEANRQAGLRSIEQQRLAEQQRIQNERDTAIAANKKKTDDAKLRLQELKDKADKAAADKKGGPKAQPKNGGDTEFGGKARDGGAKSELQVSGLAASLTRGGFASPEEQKVKAIDKTTDAIKRQESAYDALSRAADEARMAAVGAAQMAGKTAEEQGKAGDEAAAKARAEAEKKIANQKQQTQQQPADAVPQPSMSRQQQYEASRQAKQDLYNARRTALLEKQRSIGVKKTPVFAQASDSISGQDLSGWRQQYQSGGVGNNGLQAEAERIKQERKTRSEVKKMRPVRPYVHDTIGQAKSIAAHVEAEKSKGNTVITNRGDVGNIVDFANANSQFESRPGTVRRVPQMPIPDLSGVTMPDISSPDRIGQPALEVKVDSSKQEELLNGVISELRSLRSIVTSTGGLA